MNFVSSTPITRDPFFEQEAELEEFYPLVYNELRRLAAYYMKQERTNHTLQPTALVHEAYLRLVRQEKQNFMNRTEFISVAANMMRRILVNHAVRRNRQKREGENIRITLDRAVDALKQEEFNLLDIEEALRNLEKNDRRTARVFELRFFGGLTVEETSEVLEISPATTKREWKIAALYLQRTLFENK